MQTKPLKLFSNKPSERSEKIKVCVDLLKDLKYSPFDGTINSVIDVELSNISDDQNEIEILLNYAKDPKSRSSSRNWLLH